MQQVTRRHFLRTAAQARGAGGVSAGALAQVPGERPARDPGVTVLNPQGRVPVSFIIDDSTCLVNLNQFAIPQFAAAWGKKKEFKQPWRELAGRDPRRLRPQVRRLVRRAGRQRASTASSRTRRASAGSTASCRAGPPRRSTNSLDVVRKR